MELTLEGKILCLSFGQITAIDCHSLRNEESCSECVIYKVAQDLLSKKQDGGCNCD